MSAKVLVVEDEPALVDTLEYSLKRQGYEVVTATDGAAALATARSEVPDLVILDVMLPVMDGFEVCRILRQETNVPILMLTARVEEVDKVVGLEVGADDYLTKPFSMRELMARVKALLRRMRMYANDAGGSEADVSRSNDVTRDRRVYGDLVIDIGRREVTCGGELRHLKPKEFDLLEYLARNEGLALSRDQILERVWGWDYDGGSRTVDVHVRWLREKIEANPSQPKRLLTVRGIGYRFDG